ncbi:hypothetical protein E4K67_01845 [Desulfosporosinus fructosivorans]|uniref:Transglutaminase-like domain-containing protein n=1 Tax=Desulfosporosinus fructosivorans TaxID=2018669 RepID=A0A4Z0R978_9FIRM|nr:transglutaminase domain-containing protein [Desulfosporosinus fructosivorans]TGE39761.1 hypothetical protein E4K67_01845 [Desulfosporosinus fructosivorans]
MLKQRAIKFVLVLLLSMTCLASNPFNALANGETATDLTQLEQAIKEDMINRESNFTINYVGDTTKMLGSLGIVTKQAEESDGYLHLSWTTIRYQVSGEAGKASINFTVEYLTTMDQENFVTSQVKEIVPTIITATMTDFEKEKAIHDWILKNVAYDYKVQQRTAYSALTSGKTVCSGYAMLAEKMLTEAGIKTIIVSGSIPGGLHAWNMVQIDGNWYQFDATNNDVRGNTTKYYNKTDAYMTKNGFVWDKTKLPQALTVYQPETAKSSKSNQESSQLLMKRE